MNVDLYIGGIWRPVKTGTLVVQESINGRSTLEAGILSADASYRPQANETLALYRDSEPDPCFAGIIREPDEETLSPEAIVTKITAGDYSGLADRRLVKASTPGGVTGRDAIDYGITFLASYGVTRDPAMPPGATLGALSYDYASLTTVFNDIVRLAAPAGWLWRIDESLVFRAWQPSAGEYPAPWALSAGNMDAIIVGALKVKQNWAHFFNRVIVVYGDGSATPGVAVAEDLASQASVGIFETAVQVPGPIDAGTATAVANSILAQAMVVPREIVFTTFTGGLRAGQTMTVNLPIYDVNNQFLLTEVRFADEDADRLKYTIKAIEGGIVSGSWKDTYRQWSGSSGSGLISVGGAIVTAVVGRASYTLGGSALAGVSSAGPATIDAFGYVDVMLDSAALPLTTSVTAVVQLRTADPSVSVTPHVYDVTNPLSPTLQGSGSAVTGTDWTSVAFPITRNAGQRFYRLRLTPDTADVDVFALGYLETGR